MNAISRGIARRLGRNARGDFPPRRIERPQPRVVHRRRACAIHEPHAPPGALALQVSANGQVQQQWSGARRTVRDRKPMLQSMGAVNEPLFDASVPLIANPLHIRRDTRLLCHVPLSARKAIAPELQSPTPGALVTSDVKAAAIETRSPLLLPIARLIAASVDWKSAVLVPLVLFLNARPVR